jgi:hypothetical protein
MNNSATRKFSKKVFDLVRDREDPPLPLSVIPNYMGINLCSVDSVSWEERDDGQLVNLTIHFIPGDRPAMNDGTTQKPPDLSPEFLIKSIVESFATTQDIKTEATAMLAEEAAFDGYVQLWVEHLASGAIAREPTAHAKDAAAFATALIEKRRALFRVTLPAETEPCVKGVPAP